MRLVKVDFKDGELFNTKFDDIGYGFITSHRDAFRQMFQEQVGHLFHF